MKRQRGGKEGIGGKKGGRKEGERTRICVHICIPINPNVYFS